MNVIVHQHISFPLCTVGEEDEVSICDVALMIAEAMGMAGKITV